MKNLPQGHVVTANAPAMPTHTTLDQAVFWGLTLPLAVIPALVLTRPRWWSFIAVASTMRPKRVAKCVDSVGSS